VSLVKTAGWEVTVPWEFRKRIRLGPGIRLNVGKKSVSLSIGGRYARTSVSTTGHVTQTRSFPGTGLYHRERARLFGTGKLAQTDVGPASPAESSYAEAMQAYLNGDFERAYRGFTVALQGRIGSVSADFLAGLSAFQLGRVPDAIPHLERVVEAEQEMPDPLMSLYAPPDQVRQRVEVAVVEGIYVTLELDSLAAALLLAEAYQGVGKRDKAIALMGELLELNPDSEAIRLSLCDLLFEAADFGGTIRVASVAAPKSNLGFACQIFKSQAESWLGDWQASKDTLESALSDTEADDDKALVAAQENLARSYEELGLSPKRMTAFQRSLTRKKRTRPKDPRVGKSVAYESRAYESPDEANDQGDPP